MASLHVGNATQADEDRRKPLWLMVSSLYLVRRRLIVGKSSVATPKMIRCWFAVVRNVSLCTLAISRRPVLKSFSGYPNLPKDTPMFLLAHPDVAMRVGSGEAIAWLEKWRARHQPAHNLRPLKRSLQTVKF